MTRLAVLACLVACGVDIAPVHDPREDVTWGDAAETFTTAWCTSKERCGEAPYECLDLAANLCRDFTPPCEDPYPFVEMLGLCTTALNNAECGADLPPACRQWIGGVP